MVCEPRRPQPTATTINIRGPKRRFTVVWPIGFYYYILLLLCKPTNMFLLDTTIFFPNTPRALRAITRARTTVNPPRRVNQHEKKKGPNDARRVIWALGVFS